MATRCYGQCGHFAPGSSIEGNRLLNEKLSVDTSRLKPTADRSSISGPAFCNFRFCPLSMKARDCRLLAAKLHDVPIRLLPAMTEIAARHGRNHHTPLNTRRLAVTVMRFSRLRRLLILLQSLHGRTDPLNPDCLNLELLLKALAERNKQHLARFRCNR